MTWFKFYFKMGPLWIIRMSWGLIFPCQSIHIIILFMDIINILENPMDCPVWGLFREKRGHRLRKISILSVAICARYYVTLNWPVNRSTPSRIIFSTIWCNSCMTYHWSRVILPMDSCSQRNFVRVPCVLKSAILPSKRSYCIDKDGGTRYPVTVKQLQSVSINANVWYVVFNAYLLKV